MKIVFWGSSPFSIPSLKRLAERHEIAAVVTNADAACGRGMKEIRMTPVKEFALERKIPVLQPCDLKDTDFKKQLAAFGAALFAVVSYGMILPVAIFEMPRLRSVNLHASLLPAYRGASPIQAALANGDKKTGVTVQYLAKEMDRGDVILSKEMTIDPGDNYVTLSALLADTGAEVLFEAADQIGEGKARAMKQIEAAATYTKLIRKDDGKISFIDNTAEEIYNKWRAYVSWPGIFAFYRNGEAKPASDDNGGTCVYLTEIAPFPGQTGVPGTILGAGKNRLVVACKNGALEIIRIKPAGKKEMDAAGFTNGYRPVAGRYF